MSWRDERSDGELSQSQTLSRAPGFIHPSSRQGAKALAMGPRAGSASSLGASSREGTAKPGLRRSMSVFETTLAGRTAWNEGEDAAGKYAGKEITIWSVPSRDLFRTSNQIEYVHAGRAALPARPRPQAAGYEADADRKRDNRSSHSIDYVAYPNHVPREGAMMPVPDSGRGQQFARGWMKTTTGEAFPPHKPHPKHVPYQTQMKFLGVKPTERASNYASTYNTAFVTHGDCTVPSMRPPVLDPMRTDAKTGKSSYTIEYEAKPLNPYVRPWQVEDRKKAPPLVHAGRPRAAPRAKPRAAASPGPPRRSGPSQGRGPDPLPACPPSDPSGRARLDGLLLAQGRLHRA